MSQTFSSLRFFNYRLWFAGALVSNVGTWMQRIAQDWLVLTVLTDDSGIAVGIVTALQFGPFLLLSAWAGVLADRFDHRKILLWTQVGSSVLGLSLGALVLLGHVQLWHVYIFAFLLGVVSAIDGPARQVFVSDLVPQSQLSNAVALNGASFNAARLIGPGIAGLMIAAIGTGWVFIVNGSSYVITIAALLLMRTAELHHQDRLPREKGQLKAAVAYLRRRADLLVVFLVVGTASAFSLNFQLTSAMMARLEFDRGPSSYGMLGSILAIGSLTGALLAARRKSPRLRTILAATFGFGLTSFIMSFAPNYWTFAVLSIPVGFCAMTMLNTANAVVQMTTVPAMRGRVMALYMMVFLGSTPIGSPLVGWIGENWGARYSISLGAAVTMIVVVFCYLWVVKRNRLEVTYTLHRPFVTVTYPPVDGEKI